jgi:hypothetical protein
MKKNFIVCGGLFAVLSVVSSVGTAGFADQENPKHGQLLEVSPIVTTSIPYNISESE